MWDVGVMRVRRGDPALTPPGVDDVRLAIDDGRLVIGDEGLVIGDVGLVIDDVRLGIGDVGREGVPSAWMR